MEYIFETKMQVRDYECDIEGIVNNANYLHYTEHTRHLFLRQCGLSFADMHRRGTDAVVARMTLQYKVPLRCDDEFLSRLALSKQGLRYIFRQDIYRASDGKRQALLQEHRRGGMPRGRAARPQPRLRPRPGKIYLTNNAYPHKIRHRRAEADKGLYAEQFHRNRSPCVENRGQQECRRAEIPPAT